MMPKTQRGDGLADTTVAVPLPKRWSGHGRAMSAKLRSLDLHHLNVLNLLLQEFSVNKVAARVGQSQPAVSRMLRRLRNVLGDELLIRSGSRLVPTEWALAIRAPLREIMAHLHQIEIDTNFNPTTTEREFKIACADCIETTLMPRVIARMIDAGPGIRVKLRLVDPAYDVSRALEEGELDLAIDNSRTPPGQLEIQQSLLGRCYLFDAIRSSSRQSITHFASDLSWCSPPCAASELDARPWSDRLRARQARAPAGDRGNRAGI